MTEEAEVEAAVAAAVEALGGLRLVVSCAGIGWAERTVGKQGPAQLAPFETVVRVNLIGTFNVLRLGAAAMAAGEPDADGERGVVVMTASIAAFDGQIGQTAYAASKGGVVGLTLPAARDLARLGSACARSPRASSTRRSWPACPRRRARRSAPRSPSRPGSGSPTSTPPGLPHRREPDAERRDDPARRRPANAASIAFREAPSGPDPSPQEMNECPKQ